MSAAIISSPGFSSSGGVCGKRSLFDSEEQFSSPTLKRQRRIWRALTSPTSSNSNSTAFQSNFERIRQQFPEMDQKTVSDVLEQCDNNIELAIQSLNSLRLQHGSANQPTGPENQPNLANGVQCDPSGKIDWVDTVVNEMRSASSVDDAKTRTQRVLEGFAKAVTDEAAQQQAQVEQENAVLKQHLEGLVKDNGILKRAVALQNQNLNSKTQELAAKEAEAAQLRAEAASLADRLKAEEMRAYSLALHLQCATSSGGAGFGNPDIF